MRPTNEGTSGSKHPRRRSGGKRTSNSSSEKKLVYKYSNGSFDRVELATLVFDGLSRGLSVSQIAAELNGKFLGLEAKKSIVYAFVRQAFRLGWCRFDPPHHMKQEKLLQSQYGRNLRVDVVHTATSRDVAKAAARALLRLVKTIRRDTGRNKVHIGFSGGHAMRAVAREFARLLNEPTVGMPESLAIHAMAAGFDPRDPTTDPNTFCVYFTIGAVSDVKVEFVGLSAPSIVRSSDLRNLRELPYIKAAFAEVPAIDVIVASGTCWRDAHSALRNLMKRFPESMSVLEAEGCAFDLHWLPLSPTGPITRETSVRALTLIELNDLPGLIKQGKHVLLSLGPCGVCHEPKGHLLKCLMELPQQLMTDLVVDTRTVDEMLTLQARDTAN